jgi:hypothetical protein
MPLLERAGLVEVVIIANERGKQDEIEGADMGLLRSWTVSKRVNSSRASDEEPRRSTFCTNSQGALCRHRLSPNSGHFAAWH